MPEQEICVIILPNDVPKHENEADDIGSHVQTTHKNDYSKDQNQPQITSLKNSKIYHENLKKHTYHTEVSDGHTKEYPCPKCKNSLCNRFRYHTIPKLKLHDITWIPTNENKSFLIICYTELGPQSDGILDELRRAEIGIREGSKIFIIPISCALGIEKIVEKQETVINPTTNNRETEKHIKVPSNLSLHPFVKSIRAHLTVHKIIGGIQQQSLFTFDYVIFCILASLIAGLGLLENNSVILVASMLVSPLMGPIMGFVIGMRIRNKSLWLSGLQSEFIGILISLFTGFCFGLCSTWSETSWGSSESFPTNAMRERGDYRRLWYGALVAIPSGAAAALSTLAGNFGSLVGVAISASLLPPAVNSGLLFSYSLLSAARPNIGRVSPYKKNQTATYNSLSTLVNCNGFVDNDYLPLYYCDMPREAALLAVYSLIITLINILCICIMAVVMLLIKRITPIIPDDQITHVWRNETTEIHETFNNIDSTYELSVINNISNNAIGQLYQPKEHVV